MQKKTAKILQVLRITLRGQKESVKCKLLLEEQNLARFPTTFGKVQQIWVKTIKNVIKTSSKVEKIKQNNSKNFKHFFEKIFGS